MAEDDEPFASLVSAFKASFGERALDVAMTQLEGATGATMLSWQRVVARLGDEDSFQQPA